MHVQVNRETRGGEASAAAMRVYSCRRLNVESTVRREISKLLAFVIKLNEGLERESRRVDPNQSLDKNFGLI